MEEWGIYISMYTNNMTDCNTYSKGSMVQKLDKPCSVLHYLHINHKIPVHDMTKHYPICELRYMQKFIENCGFFLKEMKMKLMIRNTSDDDDKIDSTQDEGNDDDTTGTG